MTRTALQRLTHQLARWFGTSRLPSFSLATRVAIASALGATIIVATVGSFMWYRIGTDKHATLDQHLSAVTSIAASISANSLFAARTQLPEGFEATYHADRILIAARSVKIPRLPDGLATLTIEGEEYRILTVTLVEDPRAFLSVASPTATTVEQINAERRLTVIVSMLAIAAAAALGWLFAGFAVRPLRQLTEQTRRITADDLRPIPIITGATEAEELSRAISSMLARITREQRRKNHALETARDFSSVSAHELRTPLTALRTNLEVLDTLDPPPEDRRAIIAETLSSITRIEQTLKALERLAAGDLARKADYEDVNIPDLLDRVVHEASRIHPPASIELGDVDNVTMRGLPAGLRLCLDNAITNAIKHGRATIVQLATKPQRNHYFDITIDDNGCGIPMKEWESVFQRFSRGSNTTSSGSGLGLSLVAQQAELHGGRAFITTSPLGGARLTLRIRIPREGRHSAAVGAAASSGSGDGTSMSES
ncbi:HAMP domain-containing histidine kinase [Hoyosella sp. G463]|uniref:histidine kinase n=1 Tax=Lolliginicoccus lacisalsi TaxID=2742202 RepID=A0A927PLG2_9ACTN|nr:HAMP domain-containing sensor histidine kinase [Lolliginicoccus lacisalsi]MBD8505804.1 HAMP domain-containing histidine kinase [Lolliginicoccus lacisalsi]